MDIIEYNPNASKYDFERYIEEKGVIEIKKGQYNVASGMKREEAIRKLLSLAEDMMIELDVMPSSVDPRGKALNFCNQFGTFCIDKIEDPLPDDYPLTGPKVD
jgi:hypothetical protein